jgi:restriction system protein
MKIKQVFKEIVVILFVNEWENMPIPDYQTIMLPLLKFYSDKKEHSIREAIEHIAKEFKLSDDERNELLPSGRQRVIDNRVGWARTYMMKAGLIEYTRRGHAIITDRGINVIDSKPKEINIGILNKFPEFKSFRAIKKEEASASEDEEIGDETPDELITKGFNLINANVAQQLLEKLREEHFSVLEKVVLELLSNMGYGEGKVTGRSGDGGLDGFVDQDKLGLDKVYFQAKRYNENNHVSASQLRDFIGAIDTAGVNKGVFITTSKFPKNAEEIIAKSSKNIILIDGYKLTTVMIEYDVGVSIEKIYRGF